MSQHSGTTEKKISRSRLLKFNISVLLVTGLLTEIVLYTGIGIGYCCTYTQRRRQKY
jgi:hypothetical protein